MIAVDTSAKIGKSPKKPQVIEEFIDSDSGESVDDNDSNAIESGDEVNRMESADEGAAEDVDLDSGEEGDHSDSDIDSNEAQNDTDKSHENPGWADAMQKILRTKKPKRKKTIILSKAKKLCDIVSKNKNEQGIAIKGDDETVKQKEPSEGSKNILITKQQELEHAKRKRREADLGIRMKPNVLDRDRERTLQKIAMKGVVQLFNAVRQQQTEINRQLVEAGPLERKREKVLKNIDKRAFLDVLMGSTRSIPVDSPAKNEMKKKVITTEDEKEKEKSDKVWSVLRDDFTMGANLKDWDKKAPDEDADSSATEEMDSDD
ncbi:RRP15-like protein isoform X2 [Cephus cinctus]|uniref:RRP15-like protein n=1 Tax=Cephus cinctus TaxID=211228 RepID=A0AAJ7BT58_CEPCN|nr:RRP15-like protein isoform X2 [Cephus cinctus]